MLIFGLTKRLSTSGSRISNTLRSGRVTRCITQVTRENIFFNRKRELVKFKNAFSAILELHAILGPPSTGKTTLIHEQLEQGEVKPFSERKLLLMMSVSCLMILVMLSQIGPVPLILVIDEANMFSQLEVSEDNVKAYDFLIHIYCLVLQIPHATPYVVGGLIKEEAEEYFEKHVLPRYDSEFSIYESEYNDRGFILENDLTKMIGFDQVNSLVDYNFLHRRPTARFANDIIDPPNKIIQTRLR
ncbi:7927_t:CDS:2 [Diversispora eburnea]|uniref:7927_t:CDS:1 n=1 Tax=Diversispora eburnea TaxID=1213867 RepID=A0A9N9BZG5_9GLOM|nr:7927_t:CDS:2 [Diversispora eburnea]